MKKQQKIAEYIKKTLLKHLGDEIRDVILFGSSAENKNTSESDIDILVILRNPYDWKMKREVRDICYEVTLQYDISIDTKIISEYELNRTLKGIHPLYRDAITKGIHV
ncbi:nucleotidyltransferase domain-containing protein [Bacteroidota bacterium]